MNRLMLIDALTEICGGGGVLENEPMNRHTSFRIGGPADLFIRPSDDAALAEVIRVLEENDIPRTVIGNGTNLLVSDRGIRGAVIQLCRNFAIVTCTGNGIRAQAGALLSSAAHTALLNGLSGMEFAAGIPGTVGGAMIMNAGAYGGEMKDITVNVDVLTPDGEMKKIDAADMDFGYRTSAALKNRWIILGAEFLLNEEDPEKISALMEELREKRTSKQPLNIPSAGSTFKRPEGYFAGKLIMEAGLRGYRVGGAQVSEKHCGFVVNTGGATASDVVKLIGDVQRIVFEKSGVKLEPEVKMVGEFT